MADLIKLYDTVARQWVEGPPSWLDVFDHLAETDDDGNGPDGPRAVDLNALKLPELREFAAQHGVALGKARKRDEVIAAIAEHLGDPAAATPEDGDVVVTTDPGDDDHVDDAGKHDGADS